MRDISLVICQQWDRKKFKDWILSYFVTESQQHLPIKDLSKISSLFWAIKRARNNKKFKKISIHPYTIWHSAYTRYSFYKEIPVNVRNQNSDIH